jgi:predicted nuclease of restriction endonuclease-like (RecB) superfamily
MSFQPDKNYHHILQSLKEKIRQSRVKATLAVNKELLIVYWEIGNTILQQQKKEGWGTKVIDRLITDLKTAFPDMKGLSPRNVKYMRTFAEAWPSFVIVQRGVAQLQTTENQHHTIVQQSVAQLPWGHNCTLLDKINSTEERLFYAQKTIANGWTRDMLIHQIETGLYKRQGALTSNFEAALPTYDSELAVQLFKDPYQLDFIMLGEEAKERDLEDALINHITKLLLELGDGFAFMGRQKNWKQVEKSFLLTCCFIIPN